MNVLWSNDDEYDTNECEVSGLDVLFFLLQFLLLALWLVVFVLEGGR